MEVDSVPSSPMVTDKRVLSSFASAIDLSHGVGWTDYSTEVFDNLRSNEVCVLDILYYFAALFAYFSVTRPGRRGFSLAFFFPRSLTLFLSECFHSVSFVYPFMSR